MTNLFYSTKGGKKLYYVLKDHKTGQIIESEFHKHYQTNSYEVFFNMKTGLEVCRGIKGNPDPFKTDLPLLLDIGVMGTCKNKCSFCYQGDGDEPNMKLEDFKMIIDQVKDHTNQIALGGRGDPNKHKHFQEMLLYALSKGVVPNYTTSGIDLTDEEVEYSKMCGAVAVSDYGTPATYEAVQKFIDAKIRTNIHLIFSSASFSKCVKILYGYNPWSYRLRGYTNKPNFDVAKLNGVVLLLFKPQGRGENCRGLIPLPHQIEIISSLLFNEQKTFRIGIDSCLANHAYMYGKIPEEQKMGVDSCEASRMSAYISPSMKMMPCSYADKKFAVQITEKKDIPYIWNRSMSFKNFNSRLKKNEYCCPAGF